MNIDTLTNTGTHSGMERPKPVKIVKKKISRKPKMVLYDVLVDFRVRDVRENLQNTLKHLHNTGKHQKG